MHTIEPARRKEGGGRALESTHRSDAPDALADVIEGRALILWDPKRPGEKLDAIDTDQITPAADCVSESLHALDEKWKQGTFRYLMPNFRERVHAGETFLIAGDRFAIGSSREMSPAGLKAIAEEVGLEMVVVCGDNMGDIFRRNAFNLGLQVVQSKDAVRDARDGDRFSYHRGTRKLSNLTQNKTYEPVPLTRKEDEIRRGGGMYAVGRREMAQSLSGAPSIEWPEERIARALTTTEQIVWAHRVDKDAEVKAGETFRVYADLLPPPTAPRPSPSTPSIRSPGGTRSYPRQAAIANDHFVFTGVEADSNQTSIGREFARMNRLEKPYYATPGDGIFHFYFPEQGLILPGQFVPGADSHSRAYGAYGAVGIGVGSTTLGFGWSTGYIYFTLAAARRVVFHGPLQPWVSGKDVVLALLARWGEEQSRGMSVEFVDEEGALGIAYRNTICNMMAEGEAQNGIFAADDITYDWYRSKGMTALPYPRIQPGSAARYEIDERLELSSIQPMIAKPYAPGNAFPADEVAKERVSFDKAYIGSCTNGSYDDLLQAALVLRASRERGRDKVAAASRRLSRLRRRQAGHRASRAAPRRRVHRFRSALGRRRNPRLLVRPLLRSGPGRSREGRDRHHVFNRNWRNRMGVGGLGYLASPAVVASSALAGYMAPPSEIGLERDPEKFGV